jgi:hypothetical protein
MRRLAMPDPLQHCDQNGRERVKRLVNDHDRIEVVGPAIVHVPSGADYEIQTSMSLRFPAASHVWIKAWPEER